MATDLIYTDKAFGEGSADGSLKTDSDGSFGLNPTAIAAWYLRPNRIICSTTDRGEDQ